MAISTQIQNLNLIPGKSAPVVVHLSQGNVGNTVQFYLYDGDNPYYPTNVSIAVHGVRADNTVFGPYAVSTTSESNLVSFTIVSAMTSVNGAAIGELVISDSNQNQIGSANFGMLVEETPYSSSVTYEDDLSIYQRILAYVQSIPAELSGQIAAEAATRSSAIENVQSQITNVRSQISTETSARTSAVSNLQTQINQIIAPSGEAPSSAEVLNARIGGDGYSYSTLGEAIRTQNNDLESSLHCGINQLLSSDSVAEYSTTADQSIQISSGNVVSNTGWHLTNYIYLAKNVTEIYTDFYAGSSYNGGVWFDNKKNYISGFLLNESGEKRITKPSSATYVRLSENNGGTYVKIITDSSIDNLELFTNDSLNALYDDSNSKYSLVDNESVQVATGKIVQNPGWSRTEYIRIPLNATKIKTDFYGGSSVNGYAYYDENKNYISGNVLNGSGIKYLSIPQNATFIVVSKNVEGNYVKFISQSTIKSILDIRKNGGITVVPDLWGANQSVQVSTGTVVENNGFYRFPMLEIPDGCKFIVTNCTAASIANGFAFYDENENYVSGSLINYPDGWYTTMVVPKTAKFVAGCDNSGKHTTRTIAFAFNNLYGRSLYSDGDSIAAGVGNNGRNYATIIAEKYGMRLNDQAVGGGTLATETYDYSDPTIAKHWVSNSVPENMTVGHDYAIIEGGFNDEGHNVPIGELSSDPSVPLTTNPDKTTMIGALESIFQYIMNHFPNTKIFFLCVHRIYRYQTLPRYEGGLSYGVYLENAKKCCARYGVEVIDIFNESNLNTYIDLMSQRFMYENDRTHPNELGYQLFYVPQIEKHMLID